MHFFLLRDEATDDYIRSRLVCGDIEFHCIERPWKDNKVRESCIPVGVYKVLPLDRSGSGKYVDVWHLQDVEGRTEILIHAGNTKNDSVGCVIIGSERGELNGEAAVLGSKKALAKLNEVTGRQPFTLQILGNQVVR